MSEMHLGHRTEDGREVCPVTIDHRLDFNNVEDGLRAVEILNETEGAQHWYLLVGDPHCLYLCAGCGEQPPGSHHWLTNQTDRKVILDRNGVVIQESDGTINRPVVRINCAHGDAWRTALP